MYEGVGREGVYEGVGREGVYEGVGREGVYDKDMYEKGVYERNKGEEKKDVYEKDVYERNFRGKEKEKKVYMRGSASTTSTASASMDGVKDDEIMSTTMSTFPVELSAMQIKTFYVYVRV